ncbi:MAG: ubiquinone/menaquinone biosynthesis methyltransferase [Leptospiraceae bacterium]|nr:ubiquinone/menaquinone biosynthesis methyltransferase [Leptospiraceae bacterium]
MTEFKMPDTQVKAEFVRTNFDVIASKYDLFNDLNSFFLHRHWKNSIISLIKKTFPNTNLDCLDLCCGTGDISIRLTNLNLSKEVYSVDFSEKMLKVARQRLQNISKSKVEIGDATNLKNLASNKFDVVTVGFGLRNVDNLEKSLSEIYRVLKPGGLFINLDVGKVKNPVIRFFADFYFFRIVPLLGYIIWGAKNDMFDYLPVSSLSYPDQDSLERLIKKSNFQNVSYKNFVFGNVAMHWGRKL